MFGQKFCEYHEKVEKNRNTIRRYHDSIYIVGYVRRNNGEIHDIYFYYEIYGNYLMDMNHAGLKIPGDTICQFTIYSYIIFHEVADLSGRSSFCNILTLISEMYDIDINRNHGVILSNIIKNYCNMYFEGLAKSLS